MSNMTLPGEGVSEEPEWLVWATVAVSLVLGAVIAMSVLNRTTTLTDGANAITYPNSWVRLSEPGVLLGAVDQESGLYGARVTVRAIAPTDLGTQRGVEDPSVVATNWSIVRGQELEGYRVLAIEQTTVGGRPALTLEYAFLTDPLQGSTGGVMPGLMHAIDTIVQSGDQYYVMTVAVESSDSDGLSELQARMLANWTLP